MSLPDDREIHRVLRLAQQVERDLYGLTAAQAEAHVARYPELELRTGGVGEPVPMYMREWEIRVAVDDAGLIVDPATIEDVDD